MRGDGQPLPEHACVCIRRQMKQAVTTKIQEKHQHPTLKPQNSPPKKNKPENPVSFAGITASLLAAFAGITLSHHYPVGPWSTGSGFQLLLPPREVPGAKLRAEGQR